jgi:hypothetical protein
MKVASTILGSAMIFGVAIGAAQAEICLKLNPFPDVIRLAEVSVADEANPASNGSVGGGTHSLVVGNWTAFISKPVVGSLDYNQPGGGLRLGLHGTLHNGDCAGHSDVTLDGVIGGAWSLSCDGRVAGFFSNSGTLAQISCDVLTTAAPAAVSGRSATQ